MGDDDYCSQMIGHDRKSLDTIDTWVMMMVYTDCIWAESTHMRFRDKSRHVKPSAWGVT